jgi:predicted RNA binding protein YcfA (HicA-like mRNA interferase family)
MAEKYREVRRILKRHGWSMVRQRGSHQTWRSPDARQVTVPWAGDGGSEVPVGTLASIRRATGIKELR